MTRAEVWYLFGLAAITLILLRLWSTNRSRANFRDPVVISFTLGLFLGASGTLSRQPPIARLFDAVLFPNAAWLVADGLFLIALCAGSYWVDLMIDPALRERGWKLFQRWRVVSLIAVIAWMVTAAQLEASTWASLERGGIDAGGRPVLLAARLAYFAYDLWGLLYLSLHFYQQRRHMRDRFNYIRLTIPWAGITLAITAPALQVAGSLEVFAWPELLPVVWPPLWALISTIQGVVAILIVVTFLPSGYRAVSWLDKQLLVHRLLHLRHTLARSRPDLLPRPATLDRPGIIVRDPDQWLATLVNEVEIAKRLMSTGKTTYQVEAPAGGVMPDEARYALREEEAQFLRGLTSREPLSTPNVRGDTYALARWYAAVDSAL